MKHRFEFEGQAISWDKFTAPVTKRETEWPSFATLGRLQRLYHGGRNISRVLEGHGITDEQMARLLSKQEELGLGSNDLMLFDGGNVGTDGEEELRLDGLWERPAILATTKQPPLSHFEPLTCGKNIKTRHFFCWFLEHASHFESHRELHPHQALARNSRSSTDDRPLNIP